MAFLQLVEFGGLCELVAGFVDSVAIPGGTLSRPDANCGPEFAPAKKSAGKMPSTGAPLLTVPCTAVPPMPGRRNLLTL
jgi:hypothetical protein